MDDKIKQLLASTELENIELGVQLLRCRDLDKLLDCINNSELDVSISKRSELGEYFIITDNGTTFNNIDFHASCLCDDSINFDECIDTLIDYRIVGSSKRFNYNGYELSLNFQGIANIASVLHSFREATVLVDPVIFDDELHRHIENINS